MEEAEKTWSPQDINDLFDKPTAVEGSDSCAVANALTLLTNKIIGFHIENAGFRRLISTKELESVVYNPNSDMITFCVRGPGYLTFTRSKIRITRISTDKNPAVIQAEEIINHRDS